MKALQATFPDIQADEEQPVRRFHFPKPISEPPSPTSTRANSPVSSPPASDDEDAGDSHDSEAEEQELKDAVESMGI